MRFLCVVFEPEFGETQLQWAGEFQEAEISLGLVRASAMDALSRLKDWFLTKGLVLSDLSLFGA